MTIRRATAPRSPRADAERQGHEPDHALEFERALFFSDAVFAIAITLLILELRLPPLPSPATDADVAIALGEMLPAVFAYVLSFATIGLYWLAHWRRYRYITRVDERLVALNLVLLAMVVFIPFPTAMIGEHGDLAITVIIYACSLSAAGIVGPLTWVYGWRAGLVRPDIDAGYARAAALRGFSVPLVMLLSLALLPAIGPTGVELSWLLIVPVQVGMNRFVHRGRP
jgi:uncharacterized membrane protein